MAKFSHPLGLTRTEWNVIRGALWARTQVPNGHFLCGTTKAVRNAVERLQSRKFITRVRAKFEPLQPDWPVVKITRRNVDAYNAALAQVKP